MFQHMFAEMNEMLDEIVKSYPKAGDVKKLELYQKWQLLKNLSDGIIDEWLTFEEKMGNLNLTWDKAEEVPKQSPETDSSAFVKGQGYYKLQMYTEAARHFYEAAERYPSSILARLFLAMSLLHLEELHEAAGYIEDVLSRTDNCRIKAICYNALGCMEAKEQRLDQAKTLFLYAYRTDPSVTEPLDNLEVCLLNGDNYQFESQLTSLI